MIDTIILLVSTIIFISFLILVFIKRNLFSKSKTILLLLFGILFIGLLFMYTGTKKIKADISRLIQNSSPKKAEEVYTLLFKKPETDCLKVINFKDQVIPKIDCCIWMELDLCPTELSRVIHRKAFKETKLRNDDSLNILTQFGDRPKWWTPQTLGDSLIKLNFKFDEDNEQTIFFAKDSSHVYICDQAL
jgi:hypothetical protein